MSIKERPRLSAVANLPHRRNMWNGSFRAANDEAARITVTSEHLVDRIIVVQAGTGRVVAGVADAHVGAVDLGNRGRS